jgi:hypothetical protein
MEIFLSLVMHKKWGKYAYDKHVNFLTVKPVPWFSSVFSRFRTKSHFSIIPLLVWVRSRFLKNL